MQQRRPVRRALLSASDKAGIVEFTQALPAHGVELSSTGGTVYLLTEKGLPVTEVSDYTDFLETMDGRMKALHPKVHGGILSHRGQGDAIMEEHQIQPIDMVVANLYPLAQTITHEGYSLEDAVGSIDTDGPTMVRSATKNHKGAAIVMKSSDYDAIIKETDTNEESLALTTHFNPVIKAFRHTAACDSIIANYSGSMVPAYHGESKEAADRFPRTLNLDFIKRQDMCYGENSHQQAVLYIERSAKETSVATATQVQSRALSYNNITGTDMALKRMKEFVEPACMIVKHANPCGVTVSNSILGTYDRVYKTNPTSVFGGVIVFNRELDAETTQAIIPRQFVEVIIVPSASEGALKATAIKQNARVLIRGQWGERALGFDSKRVNGSLLVQGRDLGMVGAGELRVVTKRQPTEQELRDALLCRKVAKSVKSNAIVYAKSNATIDIGASQMNRMYPAKVAGIKAADKSLEVKGSSTVSDVFFSLHDGIDAAVAAGVIYTTQPGGSIRDDEVIVAADEHGIAMLFTSMRCFHH